MIIISNKKIYCAPIYQDIFLLPEECTQIINYFENNTKDAISSQIDGDKNFSQIRNSRSLFVDSSVLEFQYILKKIINKIVNINNAHWRFSIGPFLNNFQILKYEQNGDHYDWHMDWGSDPICSTRKLSLVIQLSDSNDYTDCDLIVKNGNQDLFLNRVLGNGILFPSFYLHKVTPLTSGTRYSLVIWIEGDSFQ